MESYLGKGKVEVWRSRKRKEGAGLLK